MSGDDHGVVDRQEVAPGDHPSVTEPRPSGFNELKSAVDGISSKVLSDSLDDLEEKRLVDREIVSEKPFVSRIP